MQKLSNLLKRIQAFFGFGKTINKLKYGTWRTKILNSPNKLHYNRIMYALEALQNPNDIVSSSSLSLMCRCLYIAVLF